MAWVKVHLTVSEEIEVPRPDMDPGEFAQSMIEFFSDQPESFVGEARRADMTWEWEEV